MHSILRPFFDRKVYVDNIKVKVQASIEKLFGIQRRMRSKIIMHDAKVEMLGRQWAKLVAGFEKIAKKKKHNEDLQEFMRKVRAIKPEVRDCLLSRFASRCQSKHCLAFF